MGVTSSSLSLILVTPFFETQKTLNIKATFAKVP